MSVVTLLILSAVAGLLGLDATGALQAMVSRPLVVGGVTGLLLGDAALGLAVGSLVELIWIGGVPVGSVVPPDGVSAGVVAAAAAIVLGRALGQPDGIAAAASLGVLAAVPVGVLGARAEILQRAVVNRLSRKADAELEAGRLQGLGGIMAAALALAWVRGAVVCFLSLALGLPLLGWILIHMPPDAIRALRWCLWLFWLLGLAVAANQFWERRSLKYAVGLAIVLAVLGTREMGVSQPTLVFVAVSVSVLAGVWRWVGALRETA